jgi:hypothetical protein
MDYFLISQDLRIPNRVEPVGLTGLLRQSRQEDNEDDDLIQVYVKTHQDSEYVDFIERPVPLASDPLKKVLMIFEKRANFTPIVLADLQRQVQTLYWMINPPKLHCLAASAEFNKNGTIKRVVIDSEKVRGYRLFQIGGIMENLIGINLVVAEGILRRDLTGFKLTQMEHE